MASELETDFTRIVQRRWQICQLSKGVQLPNTLGQIASQVFGSAQDGNTPRVTAVKNAYSTYFIQESRDRTRYRLDFDKLRQDLPHLFGGTKASASRLESHSVANLQKAIEDEIGAARSHNSQHPVGGHYLSKIDLGMPGYFCEVALELEDEEELPFPEGVQISMRWRQTDTWLNATLLVSTQDKAYLETARPLTDYEKQKPFVLVPQTEQLLKALQQRLNERFDSVPSLAPAILRGVIDPQPLPWNHELICPDTDESQKAAIEKCLRNNITFIWGPPGTGKTHTLARLITNLILAGKTVLVSSIANVAVDQLARQLVKTLSEVGAPGQTLLNSGRIIRYGYAVLSEVYQEKRLFPNRNEAQELLKIIQKLDADLKKKGLTPEQRARLSKQKTEHQKALKELTRKYLTNAAVIFTTAVQTCLEATFTDLTFDTVIVDEASMMPLPYLVSLATYTNNRIVIAGDYQQLGPVALATSVTARQWMHQDAFGHAGITKAAGDHPAKCVLIKQRRMDPRICGLINRQFYNGILKTEFTFDANPGLRAIPLPGFPIVHINITTGLAERKAQSRINNENVKVVLQLVEHYLRSDQHLRIGVITPYRGQSLAIKKGLKKKMGDLSEADYGRLNIGTVHAFQGSEANIIIWDLVESADMKMKIGKLFLNETGKRLANVAISRAQCKLVIIGDLRPFLSGLTNDVGSILGRYFGDNRSAIIQATQLFDGLIPIPVGLPPLIETIGDGAKITLVSHDQSTTMKVLVRSTEPFNLRTPDGFRVYNSKIGIGKELMGKKIGDPIMNAGLSYRIEAIQE